MGNIYAPLGTKDFSAFLPRILAAKPDFIVLNNLGRDQNAAIKQAHELGIVGNIPIVCSKTTILTMKEVYPLYGQKIYGGVDFYWGLADKYATAKKFVDAFRKKYNRPPRQDGESGFHQVMALADAVKRAGSVAADKVIPALEAGAYAFTKGKETYQKCNHQRAESYLVPQGPGKDAKGWKVAKVVAEMPAKAIMRNCEQAKKDLPNAGIPLPR